MKKSLVKLFVIGAGLAGFMGCSFDQTIVIEHPDRVAPAQQFDVPVYNQYVYYCNSGTFVQAVMRDSAHLAVGLPNGWTAIAANFYVARQFKVINLMNSLDDTLALYKAIRDSSLLYKSRAAAMTQDNNFTSLLAGRTYETRAWNSDDSLTVNTSSVNSWKCYRGLANLSFPQGTTVDTVMVDSLSDTIGLTVVPVFMWVTVQAKTAPGLDTLFYFSKTSKMPAVTDTGNIDIGAMVYAPVTVLGSQVMSRPVERSNQVTIRSTKDRISINLGSYAGEAVSVKIYSLSGVLIADLSAELAAKSGAVEWNHGSSGAKSGIYIVRCATKSGMVTSSFKLVR